MNTNKIRTCCLICGFNFKREIDVDEDCQCCGAFQGFFQEKDGPEHIKDYRNHWFAKKNAAWGDGEEYQPKGWNKEMALKQIKDNVPEKFQIDEWWTKDWSKQ